MEGVRRVEGENEASGARTRKKITNNENKNDKKGAYVDNLNHKTCTKLKRCPLLFGNLHEINANAKKREGRTFSYNK